MATLGGAVMKLLLLGFSVLLTGCASYSTMLQHPETKEVQRCSEAAMGLLPMMLASSQHDKCVKAFKDLGYVPIEGPGKN